MSNIVPQKKDFNRGAWLKVEKFVRRLVIKYHEAWVYTGPLFERMVDSLPNANESHVVPSGFRKIIFVQDGDDIKTTAFIFDQETPQNSGPKDHLLPSPP